MLPGWASRMLLLMALWPQTARSEYAVPPEDTVSAVEPLVIEKPAIAQHNGTWTFYPPESNELYGQYVYTSPMSKSCVRNLTIHVATWMCATGYNTPEYLNSGKCIPNAYELAASIVDSINNDTGTLLNTCVQLSAHHYDFTKMALQRISEEFVEASRKWPSKHGFVTGGDGARADQIARTAAVLGVPHMEVHAQAVVISDLSKKPTFFQTRSAANWLLPGMMEMIPGRFALLVDTASAPDMIPAFQDAAAQANKQIVSRVILPVFDGSDPTSTVTPTEDAIDLFLANDVRYIVLGTSTAASYAVLGCRLYLRGGDLYRHVQLLAMATPGDVLMSVPGCSSDVLRTVIENGGMVASVAWPPNPADDILINRATGEGYQGGGSWSVDGNSWVDNGLGVSDTQDCADDPEGASTSTTVLALLGKELGDSVSCAELVPFGQTGWQPYMKQVAQYCPVSACNWNSLMPGCRISCGCTDSSLTMPDEPGIALPGGPLCVDIAQLPADWLPSSKARCDGSACRRLAFGPSGWDLAMQFWEYARGKPPYWEDASVREGFCANPYFCWNIPPWAVHFGVGLGVVDGVYALAKAWECVESLHGTAGLDRVFAADPLDYNATNWVVKCLKEDVSFEGAQGRINFKYPPENPHSPTAGYTFANVLGGTRTNNNEQGMCGYHTNSSAVVISRVISREDYTQCEQWEAEVMPGRTCPESAAQVVFLLDDNTTHDLLPLAGPSSCSPGEAPLTLDSDLADIAAIGLDHCMSCPPGKHKSAEGPEACQDCAAGRFAADAGAVQCDACPAGQRSDSGATECQNCSAGASTNGMAGEAQCQNCSAGTHAPSEGGEFCEDCPVGSFQSAEGSPSCSQCPAPRTTQYPRARSSADCLCPEGTYLSGGACVACPEAMDCAFGSDEANFPSDGEADEGEYPKVQEGFMSKPSDVFAVYYCSDKRWCPGGAPGTCAAGRDPDTVACGECLPDTFETDEGVCEPCENVLASAIALLVVTIILLIAGVVTLTFMVNRDVIEQTNSKIAVVILAGFTFSGLQVLSVFNNLAIEWFEPMDSLLQLVAVFSFDLKIFRPACVFSSSIVMRFLGRQLVAPFLVVVVFLSLFGKRRWKNPDTKVLTELTNTVGVIFNTFFIPITISGLAPLIFDDHPGDSGASIKSMPPVLAFEDDTYFAVLALGIVGMCLVPIPFLTACAYGTVKYPSWITNPADTNREQLLAFRFLFSRFMPGRYYYGIIMLKRSFLICLVPVILNGQHMAASQIVVMCVLLCSFTLAQQQMNPWRDQVANLVDGAASMALVVLLVCGSLAAGLPVDNGQIKWLGLAAFVAFCLIALGSFSHAIYRYFRPGSMYNMFICHHKGGAAAQARLLKMKLQSKGMKVFIDSDDLQELDSLFDTVKTRVQHLVVYLTSYTLTRPWCAGEITTAFRSRLKVTAVKHGSFVAPSEKVLEDVSAYLDLTGCSLAEYHISFEDVAASFRELLSEDTPTITLSENVLGSQRFHGIVNDLVSHHRTSLTKVPLTHSDSGVVSESLPRQKDVALFACDDRDDEAVATVGILLAKIGADILSITGNSPCDVSNLVEHGVDELTSLALSARALVVVLTKGSMTSGLQLALIVKAMEARGTQDAAPEVISLCTPSFVFPDGTYFTKTLPEVWSGDADHAAQMIKSFFKVISVGFSTNASDAVLDAQADAVTRRVPGPRGSSSRKFSASSDTVGA